MIKQKLLKKNKQNKQLQNFILHKQKNIITDFKNRNSKKFLKWQLKKKKKLKLKRKIKYFIKLISYRLFSLQKKYIIRLCFTRTNLFFVCTTFWGDALFWFTSKQLGFRRYQLKSPYTIDIFFSLLVYYLKLNKISNFNVLFLGYNRHIKRFIKDLFDLDFNIHQITRYIPVTYNGCKRKHKRRL